MTKLMAWLLLLGVACGAGAFPTSSNLIPTADMLEAGSLRTEFENDGAPGLFGQDAESYMLLQYAPGPRLEVGLDLYSMGDSNSPVFNAKWLALAERPGRPALALGAMELGPDYSPSSYLVATKDVGRNLRMHLGGAFCDGTQALLLGAELQVGRRDYLLTDWASWPAGYVSLGIYHELAPGLAVNLAYGWPNDPEQSGLVLLNISRALAFR